MGMKLYHSSFMPVAAGLLKLRHYPIDNFDWERTVSGIKAFWA
jgi:hypothetical protein